uniref:KH domain-containing, RNA-binding, signal transduction-associated protein 1-like isoform X2 n=1 Tax=Dermatophagoides pteronyssinus TaxID=6956 RepID=A0A6P6Y948_DERPT|nr:KH domain-containing, RNA-binding, signal transduction-associated protein 1-like isoform X2 [Dermatophagoides pteronyssinus]
MAHNNSIHIDDSDTSSSTNDSQTTTIANCDNIVNRNYNNRRIQQNLPIATLDVHKGEIIRLQVKVMVPIDDHPNYNFVGKLLGPKGNSLKWLQEKTQTKMAIFGRGSMKNKQKEQELRETNDPKYSHLNENLHVEITAIASAPEAYQRISQALFEIKRFLVPDYFDDIRQQQLRELGVISDDHHPQTSKIKVDSNSSTVSPYRKCSSTSSILDSSTIQSHPHHGHQHHLQQQANEQLQDNFLIMNNYHIDDLITLKNGKRLIVDSNNGHLKSSRKLYHHYGVGCANDKQSTNATKRSIMMKPYYRSETTFINKFQ